MNWFGCNLLLLLLSISFSFGACHQKQKNKEASTANISADTATLKLVEVEKTGFVTAVDISPMDMSYFPADYTQLKMLKPQSEAPFARIIYSRPHLQGRRLFPQILKHGEAWRLGANEATELELFQPAVIQGKKISSGRYVVYCIPYENKWTIVLNSNIDSWGLHPDSTKDVARFDIATKEIAQTIEFFTLVFEKKDKKTAELILAWDNIEARLTINF